MRIILDSNGPRDVCDCMTKVAIESAGRIWKRIDCGSRHGKLLSGFQCKFWRTNSKQIYVVYNLVYKETLTLTYY